VFLHTVFMVTINADDRRTPEADPRV
jgi:hypothetical protein